MMFIKRRTSTAGHNPPPMCAVLPGPQLDASVSYFLQIVNTWADVILRMSLSRSKDSVFVSSTDMTSPVPACLFYQLCFYRCSFLCSSRSTYIVSSLLRILVYSNAYLKVYAHIPSGMAQMTVVLI